VLDKTGIMGFRRDDRSGGASNLQGQAFEFVVGAKRGDEDGAEGVLPMEECRLQFEIAQSRAKAEINRGGSDGQSCYS